MKQFNNRSYKLQLNSEKTEAMLIGPRQKLSSVSVNTLQLDYTKVRLSDSVQSLRVLLHSTLYLSTFGGELTDIPGVKKEKFPTALGLQ